MLADRAKKLTARIDALEMRRQQKEQADKFRTRAEAITTPTKRLMTLVQVAEVLRSKGIPAVDCHDRAVALQSNLERLRKEYEIDPTNILKGDGELRFSFWESLKTMPTEVEGALKAAWARYLDERAPKVNTELLGVLGRFSTFAAPVQTIQRGNAHIAQLKQSLPAEASFTQVESLVAQMRQAWDQLKSDQIDEDVMLFLRSVSSNKATLVHVTPEVRAWLDKNNLSTSFKVTM